MTLTELLRLIPSVYADLESALIPGKGVSDDSGVRSSDPLHRPATANLDVIDHRHLLLRGLRWWCDAVDPDLERTYVIGNDVGRMCDYLLRWGHVMADEDRDEMQQQLGDWWAKAGAMQQVPADGMDVWAYLSTRDLPAGAEEQRLRVADAARVLGCTVRTIQRRVPAGAREGGMVRLGDAIPRCDRCDLIVGQCEHTRA